MVGVEYVDEARFMEYVFHRFKPLNQTPGEEIFGDVLCELSFVTRKRARRLFAALVERMLERDVDRNQSVGAALDQLVAAERT